ncbi:hypothetical protein ACLB2K_034182 [Fragaria x ananassa]
MLIGIKAVLYLLAPPLEKQLNTEFARLELQKEFKDIKQEEQISMLHKMLAPHLLRGLPDNILEVIFERLNLMDCMSISDVCKSWRSVVAQELSGCQWHGFPWLLMSW